MCIDGSAACFTLHQHASQYSNCIPQPCADIHLGIAESGMSCSYQCTQPLGWRGVPNFLTRNSCCSPWCGLLGVLLGALGVEECDVFETLMGSGSVGAAFRVYASRKYARKGVDMLTSKLRLCSCWLKFYKSYTFSSSG